jgi:hypothetical protein
MISVANSCKNKTLMLPGSRKPVKKYRPDCFKYMLFELTSFFGYLLPDIIVAIVNGYILICILILKIVVGQTQNKSLSLFLSCECSDILIP